MLVGDVRLDQHTYLQGVNWDCRTCPAGKCRWEGGINEVKAWPSTSFSSPPWGSRDRKGPDIIASQPAIFMLVCTRSRTANFYRQANPGPGLVWPSLSSLPKVLHVRLRGEALLGSVMGGRTRTYLGQPKANAPRAA